MDKLSASPVSELGTKKSLLSHRGLLSVLALCGLAGSAYGLSLDPAHAWLWGGSALCWLAAGITYLNARAREGRAPDRLAFRDAEEQQRTSAFGQKTPSLELMYDVVASINVSGDLDDLLARTVQTLGDALGAKAASIRLTDSESGLQLRASFGVSDASLTDGHPELTAAHCVCGEVMRQGHLRVQAQLGSCCRCCADVASNFSEQNDLRMVVVPLQYRNHVFGVLTLYVSQEKLAVHEDIVVLLTSLGQHLGMAIERAGLDRETERLSRYEERTHLAHELHDSLAQTLASLRFQVRTLDEALHRNQESVVWEKLEGVESGIDEAYMELRELIARFRAPIMDHTGLVPSIEKIVQSFKQSSGILTFFYNDLRDEPLPENIQPQVVRIVQEALANVRKHSQATAVRVMMRKEDSGRYRVLIEDDGIGFDIPEPLESSGGEHIGLSVMRERAEQINGELKVESEVGEGTRIHLTFKTEGAHDDKEANIVAV